MNNRGGRKRGSSHAQYRRGDQGSPLGGRPKPPLPDFVDGMYRYRPVLYTMTSLIGSTVEVRVLDGDVYEGILRTASPQMEVALELAIKKNQPRGKVAETLFFKWSEVVAITASSVSGSVQKDIFKTDSEVSHANGHIASSSTSRELQPFQFDDAETVPDANLDSVQNEGWTAEDMFDTNKEKFNVKSSFNPEMPEYTTQLIMADTEEDARRRQEAERKAREIEISAKNKLLDDEGTEEQLFSSVIRDQVETEDKSFTDGEAPKTIDGTDKMSPVKEVVIAKESKVVESTAPSTEKMATANPVKLDQCEQAQIVPEIIQQQQQVDAPVDTKMDTQVDTKPDNPVDAKADIQADTVPQALNSVPVLDAKAQPDSLETQTQPVAENLSQDMIEPIGDNKETVSASKFRLNPDAKEFKFNPEAKEFKPSDVPSPTPTSTSSPLLSQPSNRPPRHYKNNNRPRPPHIHSTVEQVSSLYSSYPMSVTGGAGIRPVQVIPQAPAAPPGGIILTRPAAYTTPMLGPQANQQFYNIPSTLAATPTHSTYNQPLLLPNLQQGTVLAAPPTHGGVVYMQPSTYSIPMYSFPPQHQGK